MTPLVWYKLIARIGLPFITLIGALLPLKLNSSSIDSSLRQKLIAYSTFVTAGVFLSVGICHMLPDALEAAEQSYQGRFPLVLFVCCCGFITVWSLDKLNIGDREIPSSQIVAVAANASIQGSSAICVVSIAPHTTSYGSADDEMEDHLDEHKHSHAATKESESLHAEAVTVRPNESTNTSENASLLAKVTQSAHNAAQQPLTDGELHVTVPIQLQHSHSSSASNANNATCSGKAHQKSRSRAFGIEKQSCTRAYSHHSPKTQRCELDKQCQDRSTNGPAKSLNNNASPSRLKSHDHSHTSDLAEAHVLIKPLDADGLHDDHAHSKQAAASHSHESVHRHWSIPKSAMLPLALAGLFSIHSINAQSSQQHLILLMDVLGTHKMTQVHTTGQLCVLDCAGSERVSTSGSSGARLTEASSINKSLSELNQLLQQLTSGKDKSQLVGVRNSRLTRLLSFFMRNHSAMALFVCVAPCIKYVDESWLALQFAARARRVQLGELQQHISESAALQQSRQLAESYQKQLVTRKSKMTEERARFERQMQQAESDKQALQLQIDKLTKQQTESTSSQSDASRSSLAHKQTEASDAAKRLRAKEFECEQLSKEVAKSQLQFKSFQDEMRIRLSEMTNKLTEQQEASRAMASEKAALNRPRTQATCGRFVSNSSNRRLLNHAHRQQQQHSNAASQQHHPIASR